MTPSPPGPPTITPFFHFGLIVTGKGEEVFLGKLFRSLMANGNCFFEVVRWVPQRTPRTSPERELRMIGRGGKMIPDKDAEEIGLPARRYINGKNDRFVILIDDLEFSRREIAHGVFDRYRKALDVILLDGKDQASVHFLVMMLEAYYFADANALNSRFGGAVEDYDGDVETIRHPKNDCKGRFPGFDEIQDGETILEILDVEHVLSRRETCASLRTLFAWCAKKMDLPPYPDDTYRLNDGSLSDVTCSQLE